MVTGYYYLMTDKATLRKTLLKKRAQLTAEEIVRASDSITEQVLRVVDWSAMQHAHIYASQSAWNEVRTDDLIRQLRRRFPNLVIDVPSHMPDALQPSIAYDIVVVPVLGFDAEMFRLGFGKGWYDRFLANQPQAKKIGIAYAWSQCDYLPHESHDIPLDTIVTDQT